MNVLIVEDATITEKGQVTIPKNIREKLELEKGSKVSFRLKEGELIVSPEYDDPLSEMKEMRKEVSFSDHEIEYMIEESKEKWSDHK